MGGVIFLILYLVHAGAIVLGVWLMETARRRLGARLCGQCSYNLRGLPTDSIRCPECGVSFEDRPPREPEHATYLKSRLALGAALVLLSVGSCCSGMTLTLIRAPA